MWWATEVFPWQLLRAILSDCGFGCIPHIQWKQILSSSGFSNGFRWFSATHAASQGINQTPFLNSFLLILMELSKQSVSYIKSEWIADFCVSTEVPSRLQRRLSLLIPSASASALVVMRQSSTWIALEAQRRDFIWKMATWTLERDVNCSCCIIAALLFSSQRSHGKTPK